ncbi:MAG: UvrD-helicase domain-containing protein, partial [Lachnospiraceae bacterium]|nr:UvrD-helicase domain-containing protein [Lachnospiraceae bacterium]
MAINFTDRQKEVLDARNHNILVSAAAGSGKTAVLVERIVRMISEGDHPLDIDRLLVVTFTRAAAAQMRERIGKAISDRLKADPQNGHLQRQEMLLHNAQITTIDSFCTFLLRNNFSEIDLDPGFRQMDETERALLEGEVMQDFLEKKYAENDRDFLACAEYFCPRGSDKGLEELIHALYARSTSHPQPEKWLRERALDYEIQDIEDLFGQIWMQAGLLQALQRLLESEKQYDAMIRMSLQPDGPTPYADFLETEQSQIFEPLHKGRAGEVLDSMAGGTGSLMPYAGTLSSEDARILWDAVCRTCVHNFARIPTCGKKAYPLVDEEVQKTVKSMRDAQKDMIQKLNKHYSHNTPEVIAAMMDRVSPFLK